ncbi:MAG: hypothetical protein AAB683_00120 [Patescibacteria group bacterium]
MSDKSSPKQCFEMGGQVAERLMTPDVDHDLLQEAIEKKDHPFWQAFSALTKNFFVAVEVAKETILEWIADLTIPAQLEFVVVEKFTTTNPDVKFWDFGSNFKSLFMSITDKPTDEAKVAISRFRISAKFAEMTPEQPAPRIVIMSQIYWMLTQQPKGEKPNGKNRRLLVNGCANLFRAIDVNGEECAVYAFWRDGRGWNVFASGLEGDRQWGAGGQVISCKSLVSVTLLP